MRYALCQQQYFFLLIKCLNLIKGVYISASAQHYLGLLLIKELNLIRREYLPLDNCRRKDLTLKIIHDHKNSHKSIYNTLETEMHEYMCGLIFYMFPIDMAAHLWDRAYKVNG